MAKQSPMKPSQRIEAIVAMYKQGKTLHEIGTHFMVTRERIRQLLAKSGISCIDGGGHVKTANKRAAIKEQKDKRCLERYGCTYDVYREFLRIGRELSKQGVGRDRQPIGAFLRQVNSAKNRGIEFKLKFFDWWQVWQSSGKWEQRGVGANGYVMARLMDSGPYELGNIYITTASKNIKHYQERRQNKSFDDWSDCYFPHKEAA